jgi:hypothetical protein
MSYQEGISQEAAAQGICHTDEECARMYAELSDDLRIPALLCLRKELNPVLSEIKNAYRKDPKNWYVGYHFGWGMSVRNLLREKGFGEEYFKIHNLDDIYVALIEEALELHSGN